MAKIYIVPWSLFVPGRLGAAARYEKDRERILRRKAALEAELARIPEKLAEVDRQIAQHSLERWRIKDGTLQPMGARKAR